MPTDFTPTNLTPTKSPKSRATFTDQDGNKIELENLSTLSSAKVILNAKLLAKEDRLLSRAFLIYVEEVDRRRLFAEHGFDSTITWLIQDCGLSGGAAQRRYQAALLLRAVPEIGSKIESGHLNMMALVQTASVIRKEEERTGLKFEPGQKAEILKSLEQTSYREAEIKLKTMFPETPLKQIEQVRVLNADEVRATVTLSMDTLKALDRLTELMSHKIGKSKTVYADVIQIAARELLKRIDPLKREIKPRRSAKINESRESVMTQADTNAGEGSFEAATVPSEGKDPSLWDFADRGCETANGIGENEIDDENEIYTDAKIFRRRAINPSTRNFVYRRDDGCCQFRVNTKSEICGSRRFTQIDHIVPVALGGTNEPRNLRVTCQAHNRLFAEKQFGDAKIAAETAAKLAPKPAPKLVPKLVLSHSSGRRTQSATWV